MIYNHVHLKEKVLEIINVLLIGVLTTGLKYVIFSLSEA
jgi:hypothetical protein